MQSLIGTRKETNKRQDIMNLMKKDLLPSIVFRGCQTNLETSQSTTISPSDLSLWIDMMTFEHLKT